MGLWSPPIGGASSYLTAPVVWSRPRSSLDTTPAMDESADDDLVCMKVKPIATTATRPMTVKKAMPPHGTSRCVSAFFLRAFWLRAFLTRALLDMRAVLSGVLWIRTGMRDSAASRRRYGVACGL